VYAFELSGREHVGAALVSLDLLVDAFAFIQQPDDALGAGLFEPVRVGATVSYSVSCARSSV
jgi:hypothetical protein